MRGLSRRMLRAADHLGEAPSIAMWTFGFLTVRRGLKARVSSYAGV